MMSDPTRIKVTITLALIGTILLPWIMYAIDGYTNVGYAFLGLIIGLGLVSVPMWSGMIWRKLEIVRMLPLLGFIISAAIWYFVFGFTVIFVTPIVTIVKFVSSIRYQQEEKEAVKITEQVQIENKTESWRDHF